MSIERAHQLQAVNCVQHEGDFLHDLLLAAGVELSPDELIITTEPKPVDKQVAAIERIDLQTVAVREQDVDGATRRLVPYSSLLYDSQGRTWVYTSPQARTFVRTQVGVDRIDGDWVLLNDGPATGVKVASVGVAQLYGAETGVGH